MEEQADATVVSLIKDLQKQITYLERKIDTLLAQSAGRPSGQKNYSHPPRNYSREERFDNPRGSSFAPKYSSGGSFGKKRSDEGGGYSDKKRPFRPGDKSRSFKNRKKNFPGSLNKNR